MGNTAGRQNKNTLINNVKYKKSMDALQYEKSMDALQFRKPPDQLMRAMQQTNMAINKVIDDAEKQKQLAQLARDNEERAKQQVQQVKAEVNQAYVLATQANNPEVQQTLINNVNMLIDQQKLVEDEFAKANKDKKMMDQAAKIAINKAKFAQDIRRINNFVPENNMVFVNKFTLQCPKGFVQQGLQCGTFVKVPNIMTNQIVNTTDPSLTMNALTKPIYNTQDPSLTSMPEPIYNTQDPSLTSMPGPFNGITEPSLLDIPGPLITRPEYSIETFKNTEESNPLIMLIILILIGLLVYRNKDYINTTFKIKL